MSLIQVKGSTKKHEYFHAFGFTLLELLIVLVIIGIIVTVAVLALGNGDQKQKIQQSAEQFTTLLSVVEEQALLEPNVYGLAINQQGYGFYRVTSLHHQPRWTAITTDSLLHFHRWLADISIALSISEQTPLSLPGPKIIIDTSGDVTPFTLTLGNQHDHYQIQVSDNGAITERQLT